MNSDPLPTRLKASKPGLGQPSQTEIELRAMQLAASDGRDAFTDADLSRAAEELAAIGAPPEPPEAVSEVEQVTSWDEPPTQDGGEVAPQTLDDEENISEQLVEDGLEEADHDSRTVAGDDALEENAEE